jgi:hypothetical protein
MTITSRTLFELAEMNLPPEQMAKVLKMLASKEAIEEQRKAEQAERKRRSRDKVVTVTGQSQDSHTPPSQGSNGFPSDFLSLTPISPIKENPPKGGQKKKTQTEVFELPDWMPFAEWQGFEEMRIKIKKPMTELARKMAINKLDRFRQNGHDPAEILSRSIISNYPDLYEPKENKGQNYGKPNQMQQLADGLARAKAARERDRLSQQSSFSGQA